MSIRAALSAALPVTPLLAAVVTVASIAAPDGSWAHWGPGITLHPIVPAILNLLATWVVLSIVLLLSGQVSVDNVNPHSINSLRTRLALLKSKHRGLCDGRAPGDPASSPCCSIGGLIKNIDEDLGKNDERWVQGTGYVSLWKSLHRAEESLILIDDEHDVWAGAKDDRSKIAGSGMTQEKELIGDLDKVMCSIERRTWHRGTEHDRHLQIEYARRAAKIIRNEINDFRDKNWEHLIQNREHIIGAIAVTSLLVYLLLWVAIMWGASRDIILTATTYYLTGAVVGLFSHIQLETSSDTNKSTDDYGTSLARLFVTILLSGLAAIGGVVVIAIFTITQTGQAGAEDGGAVLVDFLAIESHPLNIIVALTFGLTPRALINRLKEQADQYKSAIRTTETEGNEAPAAGANG